MRIERQIQEDLNRETLAYLEDESLYFQGVSPNREVFIRNCLKKAKC